MADRRPALVALYRGVSRALVPLFHLLFWLRSRAGKEVPARKGERFGRAAAERPAGDLVWIHAASVGETTSVLPLIEKLAASGRTVLLTTVTVTSAEIARKRLPKGAIHQFAPYDSAVFLSRFVNYWRPDMAMVVESEIWPCTFDELRTRKIPFVMLNGRLSEGSARNWSKLGRVSCYIFGALDLVCAQSPADAVRLRALGCRRVETPGNLKLDAEELSADQTALSLVKEQIKERPVWLAALTHPGEDDIALAAHKQLLKAFPDLLLVLVPRHPARADEVAALIGDAGLKGARRSLDEPVGPEVNVYLGDTLGEMGLYYRLAPVTFLGGSFNGAGGHNPVEAALLGSALLTGPNVANAVAVYKELWRAGAAICLEDPAGLAVEVGRLLKETGTRSAQAEKAAALVKSSRGAVDNTLHLIETCVRSGSGAASPEELRDQSA